MAAGSILKIVYNTTDGNTVTHSWRYANADATQNNVTSLINTTITNGSIFAKVPVSAKSAQIVVTTEKPYTVPSA